MAHKSINLNDNVEVILTDFGKDILKKYREKTEIEIKLTFTPNSFLHCDENGKYTAQLWNLMEVFGSHMYSGKQIFLQNKIYFNTTK